MLIPISIITDDSMYNYVEAKALEIVKILFKGKLPEVFRISDEGINIADIDRARFDTKIRRVVLETSRGPVTVMNTMEEIFELAGPGAFNREDEEYPDNFDEEETK